MIQHFSSTGTALDTPTTITYFQGPQGPLYRKSSAEADPSWYIYDGLRSVVGEVNAAGRVTASELYDAYGARRGYSGTPTTSQGFVGGLGHETDSETGLLYMRARYYDASLGRFVSEDSAKHENNWFVYCNSSPKDYIDRSGKDGDLISTIGAADISATMDGIGADMGVVLEGEVTDMAGVLNEDASFLVRNMQQDMAKGAGDWGYYSKATQAGSQFLKAWVRWNAQLEIYDYYLSSEAGDAFAGYPTPYISQ